MNISSFDELIAQADDGDLNAMNKLHNLYYDNEYVFENFDKKSLEFYKGIVNNAQPYLLYHIAILEFFINGDAISAFDYLDRSMQAKCSQAYYMMAIFINENVFDYPSDYDTLMTDAMKMNNSNAFVDSGIECDDDEVKVAFFEKAASLENSYGIHKLGEFYYSINEFAMAGRYYEQSCTYDNKEGYFDLAMMHLNGKGYQKNDKVAKQLLKKSIKFGNIQAMTQMGNMYRANQKYDKCKKYYKVAIKNNDPVACYNLGNVYVEQNNIKSAIKFFILGAKLGNDDCAKMALKYGVMTTMEMEDLQRFHEEFLVT
uniref:Sel1 repeat family protein n=1 Tax=viral metagenome TaxID=1070528 RepID=A0A6C0C7E1_9ZZZZ